MNRINEHLCSNEVVPVGEPSPAGIYGILNLVNGKLYIGSASNLSKRFASHKHYLRQGKHPSIHLMRSWNRDGEANFKFIVFEYVTISKSLVDREQFYIDFYQSSCAKFGFNIRLKAHSNEGLKLPPRSKEDREKIGKAHRGKLVSIETRKKISEAQLGKKLTEEHCKKMSLAFKGRKFTDEHRSKIGKAHLGFKFSEESRMKISKALTGRKVSDETRAKMSVAMTGRKDSDETRTKKSEATLRWYANRGREKNGEG